MNNFHLDVDVDCVWLNDNRTHEGDDKMEVLVEELRKSLIYSDDSNSEVLCCVGV